MQHVPKISANVTSPVTISFTGRKYGTHFERVRKPLSYGQFGIKRLPLASGGPGLHRPLFLSNVCFAFLTLASRLNTYFGFVSKLGGCGGGPPISCTNYVGCGPATTSTFIRNKLCPGSRFLRSLERCYKCGISLEASHFGLFGSKEMIWFSIMKLDMKAR